ncbi:MAG: O-antigen ligase family protein, partial [Caldilineaceae bacterium]|nr:O-antigen ligase family protein [Caldilineaceae bacterium]
WSRGGWLGALLGVAVVLLLRSRRAALLSLVALMIILAGLLFGALQPELVLAPIAQRLQDIPAYLGFSDLLNQPLTDENFAVQERLAHWVAAFRMWEGSPWWGVGAGNYAAIYAQVRLPFWEEPLGHAHNIYLNHLAETGLIGLVAYAVLWISWMVWVWVRFQQAGRFRVTGLDSAVNDERAWQAALALGVLGVLVHLAVHNFFDNLFVQGIYLQIALWMAVVSILPSPEPKGQVAEPIR